MPWLRADYPLDWDTVIRPALLTRGNGCCEGSPSFPQCRAANYEVHPITGSRVILTCAHLCHCEPKCGELTHLRLLCQRCHLTLDADLHAKHSAERRRQERQLAGQLTFLEDAPYFARRK